MELSRNIKSAIQVFLEDTNTRITKIYNAKHEKYTITLENQVSTYCFIIKEKKHNFGYNFINNYKAIRELKKKIDASGPGGLKDMYSDMWI
jgi:hypothetical protein